MKPDLPPTPPDNTTPDPLLAALRQQLGDYGQAPPPAAWAAIRRQMAPPPLPWWRRPRRLLPLLALLLGVLLTGVLVVRHGQLGAAASWVASPKNGPQAMDSRNNAATNAATTRPAAANVDAAHAASTSAVAGGPAATTGSPAAALPSTTASTGIAAKRPGKAVLEPNTTAGLATASAARPLSSRSARMLPPLSALALAGNHSHRKTSRSASARAEAHSAATANLRAASSRADAHLAQGHSYRASRRGAAHLFAATKQPFAKANTATGTSSHLAATGKAYARTTYPKTERQLASNDNLAAAHSAHQPGQLVAQPGLRRKDEPARDSGGSATGFQATLPLLRPSLSERGTAFDLLAFRLAGLVMPAPGLPPTLVARPDSTPPPLLVRRWSLLALGGPTLSYRTLGPAPTLAAGHPDFARLERPALGLGAQVQVRRVLSGRWAVAAGLGYQEYATRLALSINNAGTYTSVRQRDTYRLLTLPVQFTYALGVPRGRLAVGLLLGTELGWYVGGRSTEGSDCGCQQQVYPTDSARTSPYRPLSLALSLGLDLRYRLGGPASRWHLVVQPTGRYVATPFVRSDAVGFTRRQPFSLGLLTGFSWDLH